MYIAHVVGKWIIIAIIRGDLSYNDPLVVLWFMNVEVSIRGDVLGHIAWSITRADSISKKILQGAKDFWDWRISQVKENKDYATELMGIYWLVSSDAFDVRWWPPSLEYASSVVPNFHTKGMLGERLALVSHEYPETVLGIANNILKQNKFSSYGEEYNLIEHAVPQVIASAFDTEDPILIKQAKELMDRLGEAGYLDLQNKVSKLRSTGEDIEPPV